jgi:hypothetical protein
MSKATKQQDHVEEMERQLRELQAQYSSSQEEIAQLETEQRTHMVAARVGKDGKAQTAIDRLAEQINKRRADALLDYRAMAELSTNIEAEKANLLRQQRHAQFESVLSLLRDRAEKKLEERFVELAAQLKEVNAEIVASDQKTAGALRNLGPSFYSAAQGVGQCLARWRATAAAQLLADALYIRPSHTGADPLEMPAVAARYFKELLQQVEAADAGTDSFKS